MELDVTGRQGRTALGKARSIRTRCNDPSNRLTASGFGYVPCDSHTGLDDGASGRKHVTAIEDRQEHPKGKRTIHMEHQLPSEMAKRMAGKFGLRKVKHATTGEEAVQSHRAHHNDSNETCEVRARRFVQAAMTKREEGSAPAAVQEALQVGGDVLLRVEKLLRKHEESAARPQTAPSESTRRRLSDDGTLGAPHKYTTPAPFATAATEPPSLHRSKKHVPPPTTGEVVHSSKRITKASTFDIPFDTVHTNEEYPAPPSCGGHAAHHAGKRHVDPVVHPAVDRDSISALKAQAKARPLEVQEFIFGPISSSSAATPAAASVERFRAPRPSTSASFLDHSSAPATARSAAVPQGRFAAIKYKPTALW